MARHALLNNVAHKNLRVITRHSAELGDNVSSVVSGIVATIVGDSRDAIVINRQSLTC